MTQPAAATMVSSVVSWLISVDGVVAGGLGQRRGAWRRGDTPP